MNTQHAFTVANAPWLVQARRDLDDPDIRSALESDEVLASGFVAPLLAVSVADLSPVGPIAGERSGQVRLDGLVKWVLEDGAERPAELWGAGPKGDDLQADD